MQLNIVFSFSRLIAAVVLIVNVNPSFRTGAPSNPQLVVDTLLDSNNIAYQSCTSNPNDCSLRGAISKANLETGHVYQIILPAGTYGLSIPGAGEEANATGDLDIHTHLSITGSGKDTTGIDAQGIDRVLHVHVGSWVKIQGVKITGGKTPDGGRAPNSLDGSPSEDGGGVYNAGSLELEESAVTNNHTGHGGDGANAPNYGNGAASGEGGGIYNTSSLTIKHTTILSNTTGMGGNGGTNCINIPPCAIGANAGDGGGILNIGALSISYSNFSANVTGAGGNGGYWEYSYYVGTAAGGVGGSGGGLANRGSIQAISVTFESNIAGAGGASSGSGGQGGGIYNSGWIAIDKGQINQNHSGDGAVGAGAGSGGYGGGIYNIGQFFLNDSIVEDNLTGNGGDGYLVKSPGYSGDNGILLKSASVTGGDGGFGGGIFNNGNLSLFITRVEGNVTGNGGKIPLLGLIHGSGGSGGGIYNAGNLELSFSPVLSNTTGNGYDSDGGGGGQGGPGGGIFNANSGILVSRFSPVTGNRAGRGGAPGDGWDTPGSGGHGGGLYSEGSLDLRGAMVTRNAAGSGGAGSGSMADAPGGDGGGLYIVASGPFTLTNCIIAENQLQSGGKGSGLYLDGSANLLQLTIARNSGGDGSGINFTGSELTLKNSILVSQTVGITATSGTIQLANTLWGSGAWGNLLDWGGAGSFIHSNDIFGDPIFTDPEQGDYHIQPSSPAIDNGLFTNVVNDIDNQPRPNPNTGIPDLGADEVWTLMPINAVTINGSPTITATVPVSFTVVITPTGATPNITYIWYPSPSLGQGSDTAIYSWSDPGTYTLTVTAQNAGSIAQAAKRVNVVPGPIFIQYLPILEQGTK